MCILNLMFILGAFLRVITIITWMIPQLTQCPLPKNLIYHLMEILIKVYDLYHALHILDQIFT